MGYVDKTLECADCGATFTFTAEEQEFFATKGYAHEPKRCTTCRKARKSQRYGSDFGFRREMFPAVCAQCGKDTEVPFQPREGRPVYCSECYNELKANKQLD